MIVKMDESGVVSCLAIYSIAIYSIAVRSGGCRQKKKTIEERRKRTESFNMEMRLTIVSEGFVNCIGGRGAY